MPRGRLIGLVVATVLLAGCGGGDTDTRGARVVEFTVDSRLVGRELRQKAVVPAGADEGERRPLVVFLHGRGQRPGALFSDEFYAELERLGERAPIVVEVDGGDHSYYHDRRDGRWGSYVIREALPAAVERLDADPERVAIGGVSMGGFGALDLARTNPGRFCAVGGHSPAIWRSAAETPSGAFDDADDFARHDLYGYVQASPRPYAGTPIWIDVGRSDPFRPADTELVDLLRSRGADVTAVVPPGEHEGAYWDRNADAYLRFYAKALERC